MNSLASPEGTLGILPAEILTIIFFEHCCDAVSNLTIVRLSTFYRAFVRKYAPADIRLRATLLRAGVVFSFDEADIPDFLLEKPVSFAYSSMTQARCLPFYRGPTNPDADPARGDYGNKGLRAFANRLGVARFALPGVPEKAYSYLSASRARIQLLKFAVKSPPRQERERWWERLLERARGEADSNTCLAAHERDAVSGLYLLRKGDFAPRAGIFRFVLLVSMPLLGHPVGKTTCVHLFIPVRSQTHDPFCAAVERSGLVKPPDGAFRLQTTRFFRLRFGATHPVDPAIATYELERPDLEGRVEIEAARIARLKDDFRRHRERRWGLERRTEKAGSRILVHIEFLIRAFRDLAATVDVDIPAIIVDDDFVPVLEPGWAEEWSVPVLAEFVVNQIRSPVDSHKSWERMVGALYIQRPSKPVRRALDAVRRVCADLRVLLVGGRYELVVDCGAYDSACSVDTIAFDLVLDGTTLVSFDDHGEVVQSKKQYASDRLVLRTEQIRLRPPACYNVVDRLRAYAELVEDGAG